MVGAVRTQDAQTQIISYAELRDRLSGSERQAKRPASASNGRAVIGPAALACRHHLSDLIALTALWLARSV
jgi:hypothetical protein